VRDPAVIIAIFGLGIEYVIDLGGPDSPAMIIPMFGFAAAAGSIIAEVVLALCGLSTGTPKQRIGIKIKSSVGYRREEPGY
jgi:hypothetical protein